MGRRPNANKKRITTKDISVSKNDVTFKTKGDDMGIEYESLDDGSIKVDEEAVIETSGDETVKIEPPKRKIRAHIENRPNGIAVEYDSFDIQGNWFILKKDGDEVAATNGTGYIHFTK